MSFRHLCTRRYKNTYTSHQYLNKTRGFEGSHVILVRTHQDLKMVKKIVYSPKKCREKFHVMGRKKRSETRQTRERERERWREREIKDKRDTYFVKRTT